MSAKTSLRLRPRTWIEISRRAALRNIAVFRDLIGPRVYLWGVVKSNAYGHGLYAWSSLIAPHVDGLCVDSLIEGVRLRESGIAKPILVIGPTLPDLFEEARRQGIIVSISTLGDLKKLLGNKNAPEFHLEFDTGFHRRGFWPEDASKVISLLKGRPAAALLRGIYTHFSSAKDPAYPGVTEAQFERFANVAALFRAAGFTLMAHAAATGGALLGKRYHMHAVRIGMGLYGEPPSRELAVQVPHLGLAPALSWKTVITEVKQGKKGAYVGYDGAERLVRDTTIAILPVGYWHGFPRSLSGPIGEVLLRGRRTRVLGRVSMDMIAIDATGARAKAGDVVTLLGKDGKEEISAMELGQKSGTSHYEALTRINPLIDRKVA